MFYDFYCNTMAKNVEENTKTTFKYYIKCVFVVFNYLFTRYLVFLL